MSHCGALPGQRWLQGAGRGGGGAELALRWTARDTFCICLMGLAYQENSHTVQSKQVRLCRGYAASSVSAEGAQPHPTDSAQGATASSNRLAEGAQLHLTDSAEGSHPHVTDSAETAQPHLTKRRPPVMWFGLGFHSQYKGWRI